MNEFSVALRVLSPMLLPKEVAAIVGLDPTYERTIEDGVRPQREHVWEYQPRGGSEQSEFSAAVAAVLEAIAPYEEGLRALRGRADVVLWCACFCGQAECSVQLDSASILRMSELGIELDISFYATGE